MKNLKSILTIFALVISSYLNAQTTANNGIREAAIKGKTDLIKILSENKEFNFGVSARDVESAQPANPIEEFTTEFQSLLSDNTQNINSISRSDEKFIVPLTNDSRVITTVSVASNSKETKVVELVNKQFSSELNQLPAELKRNNFKGMKVIHVPNLDAVLYIHEDKCYTSYNGRSLREGASISELTKQIQIDAKEFQAKFGDQLKRGKLVK
jgi:hypothetical protein